MGFGDGEACLEGCTREKESVLPALSTSLQKPSGEPDVRASLGGLQVNGASTILARWLMPEFPSCPMCLGDSWLIMIIVGTAVACHQAGTGVGSLSNDELGTPGML